jgi:hypothetical protein
LFFSAYLIRIKKRNNSVEELFNSSLFSLRKLNLNIQQKRSFIFFPLYFLIREREKIEREEKGTTVFVVEKFNFQIDFSQRKKA